MEERSHVNDQSHASNIPRSDHATNRTRSRDLQPSQAAERSPIGKRIDELRERTTRLSRDNIRSRDASRSHDPEKRPQNFQFPSDDSKHSSHDVPSLLTTISALQAQLAGKDVEISHLKTELTESHHVIETLRAEKKKSAADHVTLEDHNAQLAASAKQLHGVYSQKVMSKIQKYRTRKQGQVNSLKDRISLLESALRDSRRENSELVAAVDEYIDVSKTCDDG